MEESQSRSRPRISLALGGGIAYWITQIITVSCCHTRVANSAKKLLLGQVCL